MPLAYDHFNLEYLAEVLTQLAAVAVRWHHDEQAAVLLGGSEALFEGAGGVREPVWNELYEETQSILSRELEDRFAALRQEGRATPVEELVAYALGCICSIHADE